MTTELAKDTEKGRKKLEKNKLLQDCNTKKNEKFQRHHSISNRTLPIMWQEQGLQLDLPRYDKNHKCKIFKV